METNTYTSKTLDHLGQVAGMCREIGLSELIDELLPDKQDTQIVSTGKAINSSVVKKMLWRPSKSGPSDCPMDI